MPSTFLGLNTGLSGLNYYQASLNTTAHNISNADVDGYSRQTVLSHAADALRLNTSYGMMGTGVQMTKVAQIRNVYYDTKFRASNAKLSEYTGMKEQLTQLQSYLNEMKSETGYTKLLAELDASIQDLTTHPSDATYRTQFIQCADNFTDLINEVATNYQQTQQDINTEIAAHVDTINSISSQIYTLNQQIMNIEVKGGTANDLRDQRELLVDQLSELVNVTVTEKPITYGTGDDAKESSASRYEVRIGNTLLVDEMECRQLKVMAREQRINQNDIEGLYDVYWIGLNDTIGEKFNFNSSTVSGLMKGLFAVRDGNNADPVAGTITEIHTADTQADPDDYSYAKIELSKPLTIDEFDIPIKGMVTLNCEEFCYDGFEAEYDADGKIISVTFQNITSRDETGVMEAADLTEIPTGKPASVGESIDCKGIPYYMTQLNEFVRTMSRYMNDIFKTGADANGNPGKNFFTATHETRGTDFVLPTYVQDIHNGDDLTRYGDPLFDYTADKTFHSSDDSYYRVNALNWSVNQDILKDQTQLVVSYREDIIQGNKSATGVLDQILYGMKDQGMFKQGTIAQFLQSVTTSLAVDVSKFDSFSVNMGDVTNVIDNQRKSVSSVDTNEEASSLIVYQNGYNLASKVISVMNEIYDKLINQTGL